MIVSWLRVLQDSLKELKKQVLQHPSIVPRDFDITEDGRLVLRIAQDPLHFAPAAAYPVAAPTKTALITQVSQGHAAV